MDEVSSISVFVPPHLSNAESTTSRGLLPFKKRKLLCNNERSDILVEMDAMPISEQRPSTQEEKEAALTLLAAASGVLSGTFSPETVPTAVVSTNEDSEDPSTRSTTPINGITTVTNLSGPTPKNHIVHSPVTITPSSTDRIDSVQSNESSSQRTIRVLHPPLKAPLPNGCHGLTSRNNSYCRRMPCYNGSEFCKLHYQQYVIMGNRNMESESPTDSPRKSNPTSSYMDKRYTGCDDEVRCFATTTRGRECAYICVRGTRYCHLHAEYDTNPPPRRGGSVAADKGSKKSQSRPMTCVILPNWNECPSIPDLDADKRFVLQPSLESTYGKYDSCRRSPLSLSSEDTTVHEDQRSDIFTGEKLLSSISTDQWFGRKVRMAIGPFMNRIGFVERWGNGWVTVRIHDNMTHNRRSVELILVPSKANDDDVRTDSPSLVLPCVSYEAPEMKPGISTSPWKQQGQSLPNVSASGSSLSGSIELGWVRNCGLDLGKVFQPKVVPPNQRFDINQRTHSSKHQLPELQLDEPRISPTLVIPDSNAQANSYIGNEAACSDNAQSVNAKTYNF
jgi:hypothetical protein